MFELDMTQPDLMANLIRRDLGRTGSAWSEAKRECEAAEAEAKLVEAAFAMGVRGKKIVIPGKEKPTDAAIKSAALEDKAVSAAVENAREARYVENLRKVAYDMAVKTAEMFKGLCYLHSKVD